MNASPSSVKTRKLALLLFLLVAAGTALTLPGTIGSQTARAAATDNSGVTYDITTLAGKVASVNGTAGLQIRFSAFIEQESDLSDLISSPTSSPITPFQILSSPLDGTSVLAPDVTVNQDTGGAPQNETSIAVDPNNPMRIVAGANDYVTLTWNWGNTVQCCRRRLLGDVFLQRWRQDLVLRFQTRRDKLGDIDSRS